MKIGNLKLRRLQPEVTPVAYGESELLVYQSLWDGRANVQFWGSHARFTVQSNCPSPTPRQIAFVESILSYTESLRSQIESRIVQFATKHLRLNQTAPTTIFEQICEPIVLIPKNDSDLLPPIEFDLMFPLVDGIRSIDVKITNWHIETVSLGAG